MSHSHGNMINGITVPAHGVIHAKNAAAMSYWEKLTDIMGDYRAWPVPKERKAYVWVTAEFFQMFPI